MYIPLHSPRHTIARSLPLYVRGCRMRTSTSCPSCRCAYTRIPSALPYPLNIHTYMFHGRSSCLLPCRSRRIHSSTNLRRIPGCLLLLPCSLRALNRQMRRHSLSPSDSCPRRRMCTSASGAPAFLCLLTLYCRTLPVLRRSSFSMFTNVVLPDFTCTPN